MIDEISLCLHVRAALLFKEQCRKILCRLDFELVGQFSFHIGLMCRLAYALVCFLLVLQEFFHGDEFFFSEIENNQLVFGNCRCFFL